MKTFSEALDVIIQPSNPEEPTPANMEGVGRDLHDMLTDAIENENERVNVYFSGIISGTTMLYESKGELNDPESYVNFLHSICLSAFVGGLRVGMEMEKMELPEVAG